MHNNPVRAARHLARLAERMSRVKQDGYSTGIHDNQTPAAIRMVARVVDRQRNISSRFGAKKTCGPLAYMH
jgi:hypothetical protein